MNVISIIIISVSACLVLWLAIDTVIGVVKKVKARKSNNVGDNTDKE